MAITNGAKQAASNAIAALGAYVGLHTGAGGGTTGTNEATGGGYTRKLTTWTPNGAGGNSGSMVNIPVASGTYTEAGVWSASTSGTFIGSAPFAGGNVVVSGSGASLDVTMSNTIN